MSAVSQIDLIAYITRFLARRGHKDVNVRQINAIIEGANFIVAAFAVPHQPAAAGMGLARWLASDDTGLSSECLARHLAPLAGIDVPVGGRGTHYPHDPADFGRCLRLLEAVPELHTHLARAADISRQWAALVARWEELEGLYREEFPSGSAPKLYRRMKEIIKGSEDRP
jgi:hypothetical protein